ncbi:hypothetical protein ACM66B_006488 [Microbotryomycetes sp. NB124-2]
MVQAGALTFGLSNLLAARMAFHHHVSEDLRSTTLARTSRSAAIARRLSSTTQFLVTRCPIGTLAQLNVDGVCLCGVYGSNYAECHGSDENDRRTVCIEDLRHESKRWPTCGLEFADNLRPTSCPVGYKRIGGDDDEDGESAFVCQDVASPYSCGEAQVDCSSSPGVLSATCVFGGCEITMCKENFSFHVNQDGTASCVPQKPLYWNTSNR